MKYSQTVDLKTTFDGLILEAHNSGYAPGGTIWTIKTYSEKLLYASRWNHTRDTILNGADLLDSSGNPTSSLLRPTSVITNLDLIGSPEPHRKRTEHFSDTLKRAIQSNSTVLIPVEIGGKLLEILVLINNFLYDNMKTGIKTDIPVCLTSFSKGRSITYAKSMLEWLSSQILKTWESRDNRSPFDLISRLKIVNADDLNNHPGVKICLVSEVEALLSQAINKLCSKEKITIILTERHANIPSDHPLSKLNEKWQQALKNGSRSALDGNPIQFTDHLSLNLIKTSVLSQKDAEEARRSITERNAEREKIIQDYSSQESSVNKTTLLYNDGSSEDEEEEEGIDVLNLSRRSASVVAKIDIPVDMLVQSNTKDKIRMFPFHPVKLKSDDYGNIVDFKQFLPQEENYENNQSTKRENAEDYDEDDDEEDDPYEVPDPRMRSKRRKRKSNHKPLENYDDISYLDPMKSDIYRRVVVQTKVNIRCSLVLVDLTSVVNSRSLSIIWPTLKPRKIVVLPSVTPKDKSVLSNLSKRSVDIVETKFNTSLEMDTSFKSLDISIDPALDQLLNWQRISKSYTVAHVVGKLIGEKDPKTSHREKIILKPLSNPLALHTGSSLRIGDVRLPELKKRLASENHIAEFQGEGTLVVDGKVLVRKINDAETIVDGFPSDVFYKVKSAVADMLANV